MDLWKLIIDPNLFRSTCFLCFKQPVDLFHLSSNILISYEYTSSEYSLRDIIKKLIPFHDALCDQACADCAELLIKMYVVLQQNTIKRTMLKEILQKVNTRFNDLKEHISDEIRIKIQLSCYNEAANSDSINDLCDKTDSNMIQRFQCRDCCMELSSEETLKEHKKSHENVNKSLICEFCGKSFSKSSTLQAHLNTHKEKTCPYCSKTLKSHSHYKVHVKNHEAHTKRQRKKNYIVCSACPYKSLNKMSLEAHVNKIHLKIRPYVCGICQKGFYKKSNLTEHTITHNNTKDNTCEVCGDNFLNKKSLFEHLRLHFDIKPYKCHMCNQQFVTSGRRSDHFKRKHMEKSISCTLCNKMFTFKKELNTHMKNVHSSEVTQTQISVETSNFTDGFVYDNM